MIHAIKPEAPRRAAGVFPTSPATASGGCGFFLWIRYAEPMSDAQTPPKLTRILVASSNAHKVEEIRAILADADVELVSLDHLTREGHDHFITPDEDADTFEGNALLKARSYANQSGWMTIADDSGLVVDALGGAPGVHSARYANTKGSRAPVDGANNTKLLRELDGVPLQERGARFVCVMCLAWPDQHDRSLPPISVRGEVHGRILLPHEADDPDQPQAGRGDQGFGYDPLFVLPADHPDFPGTTTAELTAAQKNQLSHRGLATRVLLAELRKQGLVAS